MTTQAIERAHFALIYGFAMAYAGNVAVIAWWLA